MSIEMKDKCFQLLKELLLRQSQGACEVLNDSVAMAIDIYCEVAQINREKFVAELTSLAHAVWDNYWSREAHNGFSNDDWWTTQQLYAKLIDTLEVKCDA